MKFRSLIITIGLLASHAFAQTPPVAPPDSPELKTLKLRYTSDLQAAREPIRARYVTALGALLQAKKGAGDLDAAIAIDNAIAAAKGKPGSESTGKPCEELLTLKGRTAVEMQTALEAIQVRHLAALEALQVSFTQRGNLTAALAVRNEVKAIKEASSESPAAVSHDNPLGASASLVRQPLAKLSTKESTVGFGQLSIANDIISAHAPSRLVYAIPPGTTKFSATGISWDEESTRNGTWLYIIKIDGKEVFRSKALREYANFKVPIKLAIPAGAKEIELGTDSMNDGRSDHSAWASPAFEGSGASGLSPLDRGGSTLIGAKPAAAQNDAAAIIGKWRLTYRSGAVGVAEFSQNHTWKHPGERSSAGKRWEIEDDKLIMKFPDGGREWFILPIDPNGTKGRTGGGVEFTAVRESR